MNFIRVIYVMRHMIIDGNKIAREILKEVKEEVKNSKPLTLAVISIGKSPINSVFIKKKRQAAQKVGIGFKLFEFQDNISNRALRLSLAKIAKDKKINGILVQLPLPSQFNCQYILDSIPINKDVDVLSSRSLGKFYTGKGAVMPPVVEAILQVLSQYDIKVESRSVVIVGAGKLVGKPLTIELIRKKATLSTLNVLTPSIANYTLQADILVSATGKAGIINARMVKKGAVIIDAGTSSETLPSGKKVFQGDVKIDKALEEKADLIVPSPRGIGPITVAIVMKNLVRLSSNKSVIGH